MKDRGFGESDPEALPDPSVGRTSPGTSAFRRLT